MIIFDCYLLGQVTSSKDRPVFVKVCSSHASCPSRGTFGVCGFLLGHVAGAGFNQFLALFESLLWTMKTCDWPFHWNENVARASLQPSVFKQLS